MNVQSPPKMNFDEFMRWGQRQDRKYELVRGVPAMLPYVRRNHSLIAGNVYFALRSRLDGDAYSVHAGDFAIPTGDDTMRYADVFVETAGGSGDAQWTESAIVVVEVLSPSTQHNDFGPKREEYLGLESLDTYLVFDADEPRVWQWTRNDDGGFAIEPIILEDRDAAVELSRLGVMVPLADIYRD
ncbi:MULTISPECIES: Uma2 family endonuclease [unclassified Roseitalea]|uniref:Uma2 family endonuclease n=1 Tax=unclassified Roseitalea TaxID=2639107 RepID=UPI00273F49A2|nr:MULTISPECIES: Uma2 family endonuclease [unclassified Roseitalea]